MPEWKFKIKRKGVDYDEYYLTFRAHDKLAAFARIRDIVAKYSDELEYERVCDE
jgi:hypothetical protein